MISAVASSPTFAPQTGAGAVKLKDQIVARERAFAASEKQQLDAAATPKAKAALRAEFTAARKERAQQYAALICSSTEFQVRPAARSDGKVLHAFYARIGEKARASASESGEAVSTAHVAATKLDRKDVAELTDKAKDLAENPGILKRAFNSIKTHISGFFDTAASIFFKSVFAFEFSEFQEGIKAREKRAKELLEEGNARVAADYKIDLQRHQAQRRAEAQHERVDGATQVRTSLVIEDPTRGVKDAFDVMKDGSIRRRDS